MSGIPAALTKALALLGALLLPARLSAQLERGSVLVRVTAEGKPLPDAVMASESARAVTSACRWDRA